MGHLPSSGGQTPANPAKQGRCADGHLLPARHTAHSGHPSPAVMAVVVACRGAGRKRVSPPMPALPHARRSAGAPPGGPEDARELLEAEEEEDALGGAEHRDPRGLDA